MRRQHALQPTIQPEPRCKLAGLFFSSFSACLWLTLSRLHRSLGFIISPRRWPWLSFFIGLLSAGARAPSPLPSSASLTLAYRRAFPSEALPAILPPAVPSPLKTPASRKIKPMALM